MIDKKGVCVCYPFLPCQTHPLQLGRQPCWLREFELHTVKPESQTSPLLGVATSSYRHSASLISPGREPGRTLHSPKPTRVGGRKIRNCTAIIMILWALGETKCHSSLSNEKSICLEEGEKVKSDISANVFWLWQLPEVLQASVCGSCPLGHMAGVFSKHNQDTDVKAERKQWNTGSHKHTFWSIQRRSGVRSQDIIL